MKILTKESESIETFSVSEGRERQKRFSRVIFIFWISNLKYTIQVSILFVLVSKWTFLHFNSIQVKWLLLLELKEIARLSSEQ